MSAWLAWTGAASFMPHGHCYQWTPGLLALMVGSDALIAVSYFAIPTLMFYLTRARRDLPFKGIFLLFSAFIILCGLTHATDVVTTWIPAYWVEGTLKLMTGLVSAATAVAVIPVLPRALAYSSPPPTRRSASPTSA